MLTDPVLLNDWHVVARESEVPAGRVKAARLLGVDLVVWASADRIHAWRDACCHRAARLSLGAVREDCLVCAYHGWRYDPSGSCVLVPAHPERTAAVKAQAEVYRVEVRYGLVWVCLGRPAEGVPEFPEWDVAGYRTVSAGPYAFRAAAPRVLENFLDVGHYPFVHAAYAGPGSLELPDFALVETASGFLAPDIPVRRVWSAPPHGSGEAVDVLYTYRTLRPLAATFTKVHGGERFSMLDLVTPVDGGASLVWTLMALNYHTGEPDQALIAYQDTVTAQDIPIVESQQPPELPLDFHGEIAVPSDRMAVAYRRWLKKLGLRFGTR